MVKKLTRIRYIVTAHRIIFQGRGGIWNKGTSLKFHLQRMKSAIYFAVIISPKAIKQHFKREL